MKKKIKFVFLVLASFFSCLANDLWELMRTFWDFELARDLDNFKELVAKSKDVVKVSISIEHEMEGRNGQEIFKLKYEAFKKKTKHAKILCEKIFGTFKTKNLDGRSTMFEKCTQQALQELREIKQEFPHIQVTLKDYKGRQYSEDTIMLKDYKKFTQAAINCS